jgi:hypothetical protein
MMQSVHVILKSKSAIEKATFNKKNDFFNQKIELKFEEETGGMIHTKHIFLWCWNLDTSENKSQVPAKFRNVVLDMD